ncbi:MAG: glycosyltransferase family 2 protein [Phycisphaerae bacterium]|nr:glycosyltransferase family 2 protein [Phycisphaerae bacterium]
MSDKLIIITPAYNEAAYIERTINSVMSQTFLPEKWIIVDDGSTDATGEIIRSYALKYDLIQYHRREKVQGQSYYGSNVYAIMEGYSAIKGEDFDFLAVLDADITLPADYYQQILNQFALDEKLGVASGVYMDLVDGKLRKILNDRRSTPKAIQVFRRECFESIGGYIPLKYGGEDTCSCFMARMNGWKSWSFPEIIAVHNKPVGTGLSNSMIKSRFRIGLNEYFLGTHALFMLAKSFRRCVTERPFVLGGLARIAGYLCACYKDEERQIPDELVRFIQHEQVKRLFDFNRIPEKEKISTVNG